MNKKYHYGLRGLLIRLKTDDARGFTLVETMITGAIAMAIGMAILTMTTNQRKGVKSSEQASDIISAESEIRSILANASSCSSTLAGVGDGQSINLIKSNLGGTLVNKFVKTPAPAGETAWSLNNVTITDYKLYIPNPAPSKTAAQATLEVKFSKTIGSTVTQSTKNLAISADLDGTGKVSTCQTLASASAGGSGFWSKDLNNNNIYYQGAITIKGDISQTPCNSETEGSLVYNTNLANSKLKSLYICSAGVWETFSPDRLGKRVDKNLYERERLTIMHAGYPNPVFGADQRSDTFAMYTPRIEAGGAWKDLAQHSPIGPIFHPSQGGLGANPSFDGSLTDGFNTYPAGSKRKFRLLMNAWTTWENCGMGINIALKFDISGGPALTFNIGGWNGYRYVRAWSWSKFFQFGTGSKNELPSGYVDRIKAAITNTSNAYCSGHIYQIDLVSYDDFNSSDRYGTVVINGDGTYGLR